MNRSSALTALAIFAAITAAAAGLGWYKYRALNPSGGHGPGFEPAEAVQVVAAREQPWFPTADLVGTVIALRSVTVSNELAGRVNEVKFDSGATVEPGQVLLTLDDSTDRAELAAAGASVTVADANVIVADARLRLAETEVRRLDGAAGMRAAAEIELDRSRSELDKARADRGRWVAEVEQARARVAIVQSRLEKMVFKAPFRARAGLRSVHEGQYLAEGTAVVMLEEVADRIYLDFAVPQEYIPRVRPGMTVLGAGEVLGPEPVKLEVVALDAVVNNDTRNVRVRSIVDNPAERLRPGMFVQIRVPTDDPRPYLVVPRTAVRRTPYADQVFIIGPGGAGPGGPPGDAGTLRAQHRFVKLGPIVGDDVIVLEGLRAGDLVASTGSFKLRDGALVTRAPDEPPPPPGATPGAAAGADADTHAAK